MTREEFMDLLRYYFRNINQTQVNEILADYESHFEEGKAAGLSEEEIARELGSPKEIFEMYQDEGMIREKKSTTFMDVASQAEKTASQTWEEVSAQLPEKVNRATHVMVKGFRIVCVVIAVLILGFTLLLVFLLSMQFQPVMGMDPLPVFSPITMGAFGFSGFFLALAVFFVGEEGKKIFEEKSVQRKRTPSGDTDTEGEEQK